VPSGCSYRRREGRRVSECIRGERVPTVPWRRCCIISVECATGYPKTTACQTYASTFCGNAGFVSGLCVLLSSQLHELSDATCKPHVAARSVRERGAVGGDNIQRSDRMRRGCGVAAPPAALEMGMCLQRLFMSFYTWLFLCLYGCIFVLCKNADSSCFWPAVCAARSSCRCICIRRPNSQTGHWREVARRKDCGTDLSLCQRTAGQREVLEGAGSSWAGSSFPQNSIFAFSSP
jgi:hypothetical protein